MQNVKKALLALCLLLNPSALSAPAPSATAPCPLRNPSSLHTPAPCLPNNGFPLSALTPRINEAALAETHKLKTGHACTHGPWNQHDPLEGQGTSCISVKWTSPSEISVKLETKDFHKYWKVISAYTVNFKDGTSKFSGKFGPFKGKKRPPQVQDWKTVSDGGKNITEVIVSNCYYTDIIKHCWYTSMNWGDDHRRKEWYDFKFE